MPSTIPRITSTTRISIRVMPDTCLRERFICLKRPFAWWRAAAAFFGARSELLEPLRHVSADEFGHSHDAQENREHDAAHEHREPEDQRRLQDRQEALDGDLHF